MDRANAALARHLLERGAHVHLVTHSVEGALKNHPRVSVLEVPRFAGLYFSSDLSLDRRARRVAGLLRARGSRVKVVANGGNCTIADVNWVHSVHHAWPCRDDGAPAWFKIKNRAFKVWARRRERQAILPARTIVANSNRTRTDLTGWLGVPAARVHTMYLGSADDWCPPDAAKRQEARRRWCREPAHPLIVFIGALGYDINKGVDRVLLAWQRLCAEGWRGELVIAGAGATAPWERLAAAASCPVRFVGHTPDTADLLAAADLFVSPVRYEAYGLAAHEAVCRGVPVVLSVSAGFSERLPSSFRPLLLEDPEDVGALVARIREWDANKDLWRRRALQASGLLRQHSEDDMAQEIVAAIAGERPTAAREPDPAPMARS
jgi:glycosyltransferase involved in cell wall biosynthesis